MARLVVTSSDLVLAAGISFWSGLVETQRIQDIQHCYRVINTLRGFLLQNKVGQLKAENIEENISEQVQEVGQKCEVEDPVKSAETKSNTDDSDLDDLFEVIIPTEEETEEKIKEERNDSEATEVQVEPPADDVRLAEQNIEDKTRPEELADKKEEKSIELLNINKVKSKVQVLQKHCDYCEASYPFIRDLKLHISQDHSEKMEDFARKHKIFHCGLCSFSFYSRKRLYIHMKDHHTKEAKCHLCDLAFYTEEDVRRHEVIHEKREQKLLPCENCDKLFMSPKTLANHLASKKCEMVACPQCPKVMRRSLLKNHLPNHESSLFCKSCCKIFLSKDELMQHVRCRGCDSRFSSHSEKSKHEFKVHNLNAKLCTSCGKKCFGVRDLQVHMKSHGTKDLSCTHCEKKFKTKFYLERHNRSMHQSDSEKPYHCSYLDCTRAFQTSPSLESHMNCHLGLKPYKCDVCDTKFQNISNRAAHMKNVHKFKKSSKTRVSIHEKVKYSQSVCS